MYSFSNSSDEEKTFHFLLSPHLIHKAAELRGHLQFLKSCMSCQNENRLTFETTFWSNIISEINFGKVKIVQDSTSPVITHTSSEKSENLVSLQSYPNGKLHIESLSNLLQITLEEAANLTYSALLNIDSTDQNDNEQKLRSSHESLLGSPSLITFIQQYHLQTQVTKLRCLTECMRMELDGDLKEDCIKEISLFLDELNDKYQIQVASDGEKIKSRGLFRMLLLCACCGIQSEPFINGSNALCGLYEQTALESLLTLLYGKRMNGEEVSRWDLMVLLLNFESKGFFCAKSGRIPKLAALICAEAMSLWRFTGLSKSLSESHALFHDVSSTNAQHELKAILQVLQRNSHNVNKRRAKHLSSASFSQATSEDCTEAPEAIALLTFGLLLILAQLHHPKLSENQRRILCEWGMESIRLANDEFGGFAYLEWTMDSLLPLNNEKLFRKDQKGDFFLACYDIHNIELEENPYDDAATVVYSSIGREIISAIISAFYLNDGGDKSKFPIEDIKMLASLLSLSYRNQTTSRISFWNTWYEYINNRLDAKYQSQIRRTDPFCFLVDASHHLAVSSSKVHKQNAVQYLTAVAPLLELVSSLVCDLQTMRFAMEGITGDDHAGGVVLLPPIIVTTALLMSAELHHKQIYKMKNSSPQQKEFFSVVNRVISSVSCILQIGGPYVFSLIIKSLEKHHGDSMQLPRKLFLIAIHAPMPDIAYHALTMLSNVLKLVGVEKERCISYHITTSECLLDGFGSLSDGFSTFLSLYIENTYQKNLNSLTKKISCRKAIALMTILHLLSSNLILITNSSLSDNTMESYISTILNGSIMACDILTQNSSLQSSIATKMGEEEIELNIVCILAISKTLQVIQPFIQHPNPNISAVCDNTRHNIIYKLATTSKLGQILALHATLPVSSALRGSLLVEAWKFHNETKTKDGEKEQRFGAWGMIVTKLDKTGQISNCKRPKYLEKESELAKNINLVNYDMGVTQQNSVEYGDVREKREEFDYAKTLLKMMAKESTVLLLLWTKLAKEIFDNYNTIDSYESSNIENKLHDKNLMVHGESLRMSKDDLKNLSPVWKVFIPPSPPPQASIIRFEGGKMKVALRSIVEGIDMNSNDITMKYKNEKIKDDSFFASLQPISHSCWPNNISFLTLLSRYISDSDITSNDRILPCNEAWELFISMIKQISEINGPTSELLLISLNGGLQFHRALLMSLKIFLREKKINQRAFIFLTQSLRLLSSTIGENQNFATVLLLGDDAVNGMQKHNASQSNQSSDEKLSKKIIPVCDLFMKVIKEVCSLISNGSDGISNEYLFVVSLIMQFIVKLYDACRIEKFVASTSKLPQSRGQYMHTLEYFLCDDNFLKDMLKILNMENNLLQTDSSQKLKVISISSLENDLYSVSCNVSCISSRHINALHLRLCALKIIARELHIKGNTSCESTPNVLLDGIKSYLCPKKESLFEAHHIFETMSNQFSGIILSAKKLQFLRKHIESMGLYGDFVLSPRSNKQYMLEHEKDYDSDSWYLNHLMSVRGTIQNFGKRYSALSALLLEYIVCDKLAKMQSYYVKSWRQFIEISSNVIFSENLSFYNVIEKDGVSTPNLKSKLFSSIGKDDKKENRSVLEWSLSLVHHIVLGLEEQYRSINQSAIIDTSSSNVRFSEAWTSNLYTVGKISIELSDVMVACLHRCEQSNSTSLQKYAGELQKLFYELMDVAGKLFAITRAPQSKHDSQITNAHTRRDASDKISIIGCKLRLKLLSAALVFVRVLTKSKSNDSSLDYDKKELDSRLVLADLVCDSLHLLKYQPASDSNNTFTNFFAYDFAAHNVDESRSGTPLNLLCICLCLLNTFIVLPSSSCMAGLRIASYYTDLTATFRRWNIVPTLLDHLSCASEICNVTHSTLMSQVSDKSIKEDLETSTIHENSSSIISKILHFVNLASATPLAIDVALLFMEDGIFIHAIIRNPLLLRVCFQWYALSTSGKHDLRGYIILGAGIVRSNKFQKQKSSMMVSSRSCRHDPVHTIWILVLKTLTSLIASHISLNGKVLDFGIDFFCTFDRVILSSITGGLECQDASKQRNVGTFRNTMKGDQTNTNSRSPFTSNNLLEGSASLSFISELYKSPRFLDLKSFSSPLSQNKVLASVRFAIKSFCAYLGASGISRELFEAISTLNHDMEAAKNAESPNRALIEQQIQQAFIINPVMLAGGMPNARHEAISNAHYAISCCLYVTSDDFELSEKTLSCDNQEENIRDSSLDGFHSHVNNEFSLKMEFLAAKALYFALTILSRANQSCASFVQFKPHEVEQMDPTLIVHDGSIIALQPRQTSKFNPSVTADSGSPMLRYAIVLRTYKDRKVWDVEYLSLLDSKTQDDICKDKYEKNVSFSRLACVKDLSKKRRVLNHSPAPKSPTAAFLSEMSVGHLILALRWCKERGRTYHTGMKYDGDFTLLKCLSERTVLLLLTEMKEHDESSSDENTREEEKKILNAQLFELFGQNVQYSLNEDKFIHTPQRNNFKISGLQTVVQGRILQMAFNQLEKRLNSARIAHNMLLKDRLGRQGNSPGPASGRRMRSPFLAFNPT